MIASKEASALYSMLALFKAGKNFGQFLVDSNAVGQMVKRDTNQLITTVSRFERTCNGVLSGSERDQWMREWTDKDFEVFSSIFFLLCDMNEEQRSVAEQFMTELSKGQVKCEAA